MRLHHFAHSSASYRIRIVCALKEIELDYVYVDMTKLEQQGEKYALLNPQRMVPCLELSNGTVLAQSLAIIDYLDELNPAPPIYPTDPVARAKAKSHALMIACDTSPIQTKSIQRYLASQYSLTDNQIDTWLHHWIRRGLGTIEKSLAKRSIKSPFAMGDTPNILDILIVPQMRNAHRFGVDISDFINLRAVEETCLMHPAFKSAHPDQWE